MMYTVNMVNYIPIVPNLDRDTGPILTPMAAARADLQQLVRSISDAESALAAAWRNVEACQNDVKDLRLLLRETVVSATDRGMTEIDASRLAQVSRHTVRDWRGKRKKY